MTLLAAASLLGLEKRMAENDKKKKLPSWEEYVSQEQIILLTDRVILDLIAEAEKESGGNLPSSTSGKANDSRATSRSVKGDAQSEDLDDASEFYNFASFNRELVVIGSSNEKTGSTLPYNSSSQLRASDKCDARDDHFVKPRESDALPLPEGDESIYGFCPAQENNTFTRCNSLPCCIVRKPNFLENLKEHRAHRASDPVCISNNAKRRVSQARISEKPSKKRKSHLSSSSKKSSKKGRSSKTDFDLPEEPSSQYTPDDGTAAADVTDATEGSADSKKRRYLPCKDRKYDPDLHCGVVDQSGKPCTRSLTCKTHPIMYRRAVKGRFKPFDELLADQRAAKERPRMVEISEEVSSPQVNQTIVPQPPVVIPQPPVVVPHLVEQPASSQAEIPSQPISNLMLEKESIVVVVKIPDPPIRFSKSRICSPPRLQQHHQELPPKIVAAEIPREISKGGKSQETIAIDRKTTVKRSEGRKSGHELSQKSPRSNESEMQGTSEKIPNLRSETGATAEMNAPDISSEDDDASLKEYDVLMIDDHLLTDYPTADRQGPLESEDMPGHCFRTEPDEATLRFLQRRQAFCRSNRDGIFALFVGGRGGGREQNVSNNFLDQRGESESNSSAHSDESPSCSVTVIDGGILQETEKYLHVFHRVLLHRIPEQPTLYRGDDSEEALLKAQIGKDDGDYDMEDNWQSSPEGLAHNASDRPPPVIPITG